MIDWRHDVTTTSVSALNYILLKKVHRFEMLFVQRRTQLRTKSSTAELGLLFETERACLINKYVKAHDSTGDFWSTSKLLQTLNIIPTSHVHFGANI